MIIWSFQSSVSAVSVLKTYRYDWNTLYRSSMNYHRHSYINVPSWSRYYSYFNIKLVLVGITIVMR